MMLARGVVRWLGIFSVIKAPQSLGIRLCGFLVWFPVMPWFSGWLWEVGWVLLTVWPLLVSLRLSLVPFALGRMSVWIIFFSPANLLIRFGICYLASVIYLALICVGGIFCKMLLPVSKGNRLETLLSDLCWLLASISSGKRGILGCFLGRTEMSPACFRTLCCMLDSERVLSLVFHLLLLIGVLLILGLSLKISYSLGSCRTVLWLLFSCGVL